MTRRMIQRAGYYASRLLYDLVALNVGVLLSIYLGVLLALGRKYAGFAFTVDEFLAMSGRSLELWAEYGVLTSLCVGVSFWAFGFYSPSRFTRLRYRMLSFITGVTFVTTLIVYLMFLRTEADLLPRTVGVVMFPILFCLIALPRLSKPLVLFAARFVGAPSPLDRPVRRVLVIGGAGYIGSTLSRLLLSKGYEVVALDLCIFGEDSLQPLLDDRRFTLINGDFRNVADIMRAIEGIDAVVHLGGLVGDPACALKDDLTIDTNIAATRVLVDICRARGISRFVFASTCSVYGIGKGISTENSPLNPVSLYARSKIDSDEILLDIEDPMFRPTILRFATVFGWSYRPRFDLVVNTFTAQAFQGEEIELHGGNQWRPFIHVFDVARAIELSLRADIRKVGNQIFNVGDDRLNHTISNVAEIVASHVPDLKVVNRGDVTDSRDYRVSFDKFVNTVGFKADRTVSDGVQEILAELNRRGRVEVTDVRYHNYLNLVSHLSSETEFVKNRIHMADQSLDPTSRTTHSPRPVKVTARGS